MSEHKPGVALGQQLGRKIRKRCGERGAELVEFAMVLIPMISLVFLSVDAAWAIYAKAAIQEAVREGVRYGVTGQTVGSGVCLDQSIRDVVIQYSFGILNSSNQSDISIAYFSPTNTSVNLAGQANATTGGNILQVSVGSLSLKLLAPFFVSSLPINVAATATDVLESSPGGVAPCE